MNTFILYVFVVTTHGVNTSSIEFNSHPACLEAQAAVQSIIRENQNLVYIKGHSKTICLAKNK